eukprot:TRINITY_DN15217_c0_g1_i2.p1 TRINITY_DN15217_c0_g1~~TRINITY_DN15217_c0_g1_i2.p1  ORF type:complete len:306 (-),score=79.61 TRINITY_DN15217_c0_g1_i2:21-938(-)
MTSTLQHLPSSPKMVQVAIDFVTVHQNRLLQVIASWNSYNSQAEIHELELETSLLYQIVHNSQKCKYLLIQSPVMCQLDLKIVRLFHYTLLSLLHEVFPRNPKAMSKAERKADFTSNKSVASASTTLVPVLTTPSPSTTTPFYQEIQDAVFRILKNCWIILRLICMEFRTTDLISGFDPIFNQSYDISFQTHHVPMEILIRLINLLFGSHYKKVIRDDLNEDTLKRMRAQFSSTIDAAVAILIFEAMHVLSDLKGPLKLREDIELEFQGLMKQSVVDVQRMASPKMTKSLPFFKGADAFFRANLV